jgi:hypothetical protein
MKKMMKIPIKIEDPEDFQPGTHKARLIERPVWLVEIVMPKSLMNDIRTGSIELEGQNVDLDDLDASYEEDLDKQEFRNDDEQQQQPNMQPAPSV